MKKFLTALAALAVLGAAACQYELPHGLIGPDSLRYVVFPYISHVNGIPVAQPVDGEYVYNYERDYVIGRTLVFGFEQNVTTNLPLTVRIQTTSLSCFGERDYDIRAAIASRGLIPYGIGFFDPKHQDDINFWVSHYFYWLTIALEYSLDNGVTWTRIGERRYADAIQSSINGIVFGRDILPLTLSPGKALKLRLIGGVGIGGHIYPRIEISSRTRSVELTMYHSYLDLDFSFEVTVTISGNRRGGF